VLKDIDVITSIAGPVISVDLAVHEVANSVWKHEHVLKDIKEGLGYLSEFMRIIKSGKITLVTPDESLIKRAYGIASKHKQTLYDSMFIALALDTGSELKTLDDRQQEILSSERT
jgi:predicted nucleic acid-binding protein